MFVCFLIMYIFFSWAKAVGYRLLFGINGQMRLVYNNSYGHGSIWDASNAMELLDYTISKEYASNIDFEFGGLSFYTWYYVHQ